MAGGTLYSLVLIIPLAYALSKKYLFGRSQVTWFFLFTMYFGGGLVPSYLLIKNLGLINNPLVMIIGGISVFNMVITRTFFQTSIPEELYEAAKIDGASEYACFFKIALPLSGAIIAVMALYQAVAIWNSYFNALLYLTNSRYFPLQIILRNILIMNEQMAMDMESFMNLDIQAQEIIIHKQRMAQTMKYSLVFIASAPLLAAYPFVQKYFVKGVMIGSLKG